MTTDPTRALLTALAAHHEAAGEAARQNGNYRLAALHLSAMDALSDALGCIDNLDAEVTARELECVG